MTFFMRPVAVLPYLMRRSSSPYCNRALTDCRNQNVLSSFASANDAAESTRLTRALASNESFFFRRFFMSHHRLSFRLFQFRPPKIRNGFQGRLVRFLEGHVEVFPGRQENWQHGKRFADGDGL